MVYDITDFILCGSPMLRLTANQTFYNNIITNQISSKEYLATAS